MNTNERKPVVVIYDDENVLEALHQELCNAIVAAAKAGKLNCEVTEDNEAIFTSKERDFRLAIYEDFSVCSSHDMLAMSEDIVQLRIKAQIEQKQRELEVLKGKLK